MCSVCPYVSVECVEPARVSIPQEVGVYSDPQRDHHQIVLFIEDVVGGPVRRKK